MSNGTLSNGWSNLLTTLSNQAAGPLIDNQPRWRRRAAMGSSSSARVAPARPRRELVRVPYKLPLRSAPARAPASRARVAPARAHPPASVPRQARARGGAPGFAVACVSHPHACVLYPRSPKKSRSPLSNERGVGG